jgi:hypothetical protein
MNYPIDRHCFPCGKTFRTPSEFERHKKRKTPCVIENIPKNNAAAYRCHFCNKPYKYKQSLTRHYKKCKIRNGGKHILFEKLQREHDLMKLQMGKQMEQMEKRMDKLTAENKQLRVVNNGQAIQGDNNTQVQFTLNSYKKPDMKDIKLSLKSLIEDGTILKTLMESIYYNPAKPENHSIQSHNLKEKKIAVNDDTWKLLTSDKERDKLVDEGKAVCSLKGGKLLNSNDGPYGGDIANRILTSVIKNRIIAFNEMDKEEADMTTDEVLTTFHSNKKMVKRQQIKN